MVFRSWFLVTSCCNETNLKLPDLQSTKMWRMKGKIQVFISTWKNPQLTTLSLIGKCYLITTTESKKMGEGGGRGGLGGLHDQLSREGRGSGIGKPQGLP